MDFSCYIINSVQANNSLLLAKQHTSPFFQQQGGIMVPWPNRWPSSYTLKQRYALWGKKQTLIQEVSEYDSCFKIECITEYSVFNSVTVPVWKQYILCCNLINGRGMECKCLHCCWHPQVVCLKAGHVPLKHKQIWVATRAQCGNAFSPCLFLRMLLKISLFDYGPFIIILFGKLNVICSHKNYSVAQ